MTKTANKAKVSAPRRQAPRKRALLPSAPSAMHSSARSGYASQILPGRAQDPSEPRGTVLPAAALSGRQAGRPTPAERRYRPGIHHVVTLEEASALMAKRIKGEVPEIRGGLDDNTATRNSPTTIEDPYPDAPESAGYDGMTPVPEGQQPEPQAQFRETPARIPVPEGQQPEPQAQFRETPARIPVATVSKADQYLKQRRRVTLELSDSTMSMACIDVLVTRYSVTLLLPSSPDGGIVIPKPGSALTIVDGDHSIPVYFPGAQFEIEALQVIGLSFIRSED